MSGCAEASRRCAAKKASRPSLQFVRKISGYRAPSRANAPAFDAAVKEVSASSRRLLSGLAS
ncbi:MAG: DUF2277 domain-containing protein [Chloroflexi bacterium]|nr:MAG: DUF2277 domain-containing protein [Chloroflexota bacterium]